MANTLGDKINDAVLTQGLEDAVKIADSREEELEKQISALEDQMGELNEKLYELEKLHVK